MAGRQIVDEESFQMLRWLLGVKEEAGFRTAVEIDPPKASLAAGHAERIVLRRSKDVQRQSPV